MNLRLVLHLVGIILVVLAASMIFPIAADLTVSHPDWKIFFICMILSAFFGGLIMITTAGHSSIISPREGFIMLALCWVILSFFAALPLWLSGLNLSFTDAVFEAVSGVTTTGATVITGLDEAPRGILLWRAMLQWLGGIGVIVMAMSILPFLKIGGMQLFETQLSESEKSMPRTTRLAFSLTSIYLFLTLLNIVSYHLAGLDFFESIAYGLTTISTGGFSPHDTSFSGHDTAGVKLVAMIFMIAGGLPFVLYLKALKGAPGPLLRDSQVRCFLAVVAISTLILVFYLTQAKNMGFGTALLGSSFTVISVITGTGFSNSDYTAWGEFAIAFFFFLMVVGACAGSTVCGIKIFRFQILYGVFSSQIKKLLFSHGVFISRYNGRSISDTVAISVMTFFFLYAASFACVAVALAFTGLDFITAMSGAATSLSNVGPGLGGTIGPAGTFQPLPDTSKWILSFAMLLGRLELFPILVLFTPQFWRR